MMRTTNNRLRRVFFGPSSTFGRVPLRRRRGMGHSAEVASIEELGSVQANL